MKLAMQPKKMSDWFKAASLVVMAMATSIAITACGNKGGGGDAPAPVPVTPVPVTPSCASCPGSMGFLSSGVGKVYSVDQIEMGLEFYGDAASMANYANTGSGYLSTGQQYYGQFAAQGYIFIGGNMLACGIPAMGPLQVTTLQPGIWGKDGAGRSLEGIYLQATGGPVPIQLYISGWIDSSVPASTGRDGRTYPFKIKGLLQLKRADSSAYCNVYME